MQTHSRQAGMSILGFILIAIMVGFFVMCAIKLAPPYFEYMSIRQIVTGVVSEHDPNVETGGQLRRRLAARFTTNQIQGLKASEVEIYRKEGQMYIDAGYEVRVPIIWRIDAVMKFDDLLFEGGKVIRQ